MGHLFSDKPIHSGSGYGFASLHTAHMCRKEEEIPKDLLPMIKKFEL
jgi:hypothetical protein